MKLRFGALALLPLALAACSEQAMSDFLGTEPEVQEQPAEPAGPPQPPAISPLDQAIEVQGGAQVAVPTAQAETYNAAAFVARGNEPFWIVEASGETAVYKTPENQTGSRVSVRRIPFAQGVEFIGTMGGSAFALTVRGTDCVDSMSGEKFPMTATLKIGSRINSGCASPAEPAAAQSADGGAATANNQG